MSRKMNIAGLTPVIDPEYRYQMPPIQTKIEGRGNGIKTIIVNCLQVSLALHRDAAEVTKFFGYELGSQTKWVEETEKSIVNGSHTTANMQNMLSTYIEKFVLCPECKLPETIYKIKSDCIFQYCDACGGKEPVDMTHSLSTWIVNTAKKMKKDKKKDKKEDKKEKKKDKHSKTDSNGNVGEGEELKKEKKKEKKEKKKEKKEKKEKKSKSKSKSSSDNDENNNETLNEGTASGNEDNDSSNDGDDDSWASDGDHGDEKKTKKTHNKRDSSGGLSADFNIDLNDDEDDDDQYQIAIDNIANFMKRSPAPSNDDIYEEIGQQQICSGLAAIDRPLLFVGAICVPNIIKDKMLKKHKSVFQKVLKVSGINMQRHLIAAFEYWVSVKDESLKKLFPIILKVLYDEDLLEEENIIDWATSGSEEYVKVGVEDEMTKELQQISEKFIIWLKEADEDSSSSSDEE